MTCPHNFHTELTKIHKTSLTKQLIKPELESLEVSFQYNSYTVSIVGGIENYRWISVFLRVCVGGWVWVVDGSWGKKKKNTSKLKT